MEASGHLRHILGEMTMLLALGVSSVKASGEWPRRGDGVRACEMRGYNLGAQQGKADL